MILADTSVWIDHFRRGHPRLSELLEEGSVLCHPFVVGELACGNLQNRNEILDLLQALPIAQVAEHFEVLRFIEDQQIMGRGLGWIDTHLLVSAKLSGCPIWTLDKPLAKAAERLGAAF